LIISNLERKIKYPMCVKPASLGSSVGISIVKTRKELESSIEVIKQLDVKVIVEEALMGIDEINCAVMGVDRLEASVCEQPIKSTTVLSYDDKYLNGSKNKGMASMTRLIPAPIGEKMTKKIQEYAKTAFRSIDASGVARIDFLVNLKWKKVYVNEINTIPGGFSFYIWDKFGYSYSEVADKLISLGFERFNKYNKLRRTFETKLLKSAKGGSKFAK